jgi:hypothetical protein
MDKTPTATYDDAGLIPVGRGDSELEREADFEAVHAVEPYGTGAAICGFDSEGEPFGASVSGLGIDCPKCLALVHEND